MRLSLWLSAWALGLAENSTVGNANDGSNTSTSISIDPAGWPGTLGFLSPVTTESLYVKVGDYQTFSWNYTNVLVTPTALDIDLYCAQNSHTVMLASNRSYDDTQFIWNSSDTNLNDPDNIHLITAKYTLRIYNSSGSPSDTPRSGYLSPVSYVFGVYLPQNYDSWANAGRYVNAAGPGPGPVAAAAAAAALLFGGLALVV